MQMQMQIALECWVDDRHSGTQALDARGAPQQPADQSGATGALEHWSTGALEPWSPGATAYMYLRGLDNAVRSSA
ncbi:hypothetical protein PG989_005225 [Apiospora arundinis]